MGDTFTTNDALDRQRAFNIFAGIAGQAFGIDPGPGAYDAAGSITNPVGQHQILNVSTGSAVQGQAGAGGVVSANIGGLQFSLPSLVVLAAGAWQAYKHFGK
jgi:hypothetical protein